MNWQVGLHQPWGWGFLQLFNTCRMEAQCPDPTPAPALLLPCTALRCSPLSIPGTFISRKGTLL